ncbi:MAG: preprotein translocase subunit SecA [Candidatus Coatesbacteria bacterium]|nr:preprotein translocase subunit SecA [Candidatus Coatesbacteria bacterium]
MLNAILSKIIGTRNERVLKRLSVFVEQINSLEDGFSKLSDGDLRAKTDEFRARLKDGETLDDLLPDAFAAVREAGKRAIKHRPFDVQLIGGMVLHQGKIAEMATGEGKTLVATLATYLNALPAKGVHVVTVNDYLARRDAGWMGPIYEMLGLTVGALQHDMDNQDRYNAYRCDITYGTNSEFGFDYLRDNMKHNTADFVQRGHNFAIVDEVDSILIDEARTPLIISGPSDRTTGGYFEADRVVRHLRKDHDFEIDEKARTITLTEFGIKSVETRLGVENLYDPEKMDFLSYINQALRARFLFRRDVDYMVKDGKVLIVDEFTGRLMPGRRYSDGLHQALEAKEGVHVENENQTLASITIQNYFRMYDKLSGMTGTADTEAEEFYKIYKLEVVVIPTNRPLIRDSQPDAIYMTEKEKYEAVLESIQELNAKGRPVLVGTTSVDNSERLSRMLGNKGIKHSVLNAKHHEKEAEIVAEAGQMGAVTIATNMAGRGTDIVLGDGVKDLGGLHVLGTERHESRRIDNQLRGRSGRQGDPGSSKFFMSLEDDLLRIFGADRIKALLTRMHVEQGERLEHPLLSKAIQTAQKRVEAQNFEIRKHLLEYDDVMNKQREVIYELRKRVLSGESKDEFMEFAEDAVDDILSQHTDKKKDPEDWDIEGLLGAMRGSLGIAISGLDPTKYGYDELRDILVESVRRGFEQKEKIAGSEQMELICRIIMLRVIDRDFKNHLLGIDHIREGIGLRGYAQVDPLTEYKRESFNLFAELMVNIARSSVFYVMTLQVSTEAPPDGSRPVPAGPAPRQVPAPAQRPSAPTPTTNQPAKIRAAKAQKATGKIGRNDPCPCGSGKKYKKCCGRLEGEA